MIVFTIKINIQFNKTTSLIDKSIPCAEVLAANAELSPTVASLVIIKSSSC